MVLDLIGHELAIEIRPEPCRQLTLWRGGSRWSHLQAAFDHLQPSMRLSMIGNDSRGKGAGRGGQCPRAGEPAELDFTGSAEGGAVYEILVAGKGRRRRDRWQRGHSSLLLRAAAGGKQNEARQDGRGGRTWHADPHGKYQLLKNTMAGSHSCAMPNRTAAVALACLSPGRRVIRV